MSGDSVCSDLLKRLGNRPAEFHSYGKWYMLRLLGFISGGNHSALEEIPPVISGERESSIAIALLNQLYRFPGHFPKQVDLS